MGGNHQRGIKGGYQGEGIGGNLKGVSRGRDFLGNCSAIWRLSPPRWITIPPRGRKSPNDPLKRIFEAFPLFGLQTKT